jgi:hypothetical protein
VLGLVDDLKPPSPMSCPMRYSSAKRVQKIGIATDSALMGGSPVMLLGFGWI